MLCRPKILLPILTRKVIRNLSTSSIRIRLFLNYSARVMSRWSQRSAAAYSMEQAVRRDMTRDYDSVAEPNHISYLG